MRYKDHYLSKMSTQSSWTRRVLKGVFILFGLLILCGILITFYDEFLL
jgi:hypothetical protein